MNYLIRNLSESDIDDCVKMVNINFNGIYNNCKEELLIGLKDENQFFRCIEIDGKCIGFAGYTYSNFTYNSYGIYYVDIDPNYQNKGYGKVLINSILNEIKNKPIDKDIYNDKDKIWVMLTCKKSVTEFYNHLNFKIIHNTQNKYLLLLEL